MKRSLSKDFLDLKQRATGGFFSEKRRQVRASELAAFSTWRALDSIYWPERILAQLEYGLKAEEAGIAGLDEPLARALDLVLKGARQDGMITRTTVERAEDALRPAMPAARSLTLMCVGHAHIDMNWLWPWQETVLTTIETFRTVLRLMDEYPDFRFTQSQASVYRIVEKYEPTMVADIARRVAEGRWEVAASQWVEGDKNLTNGESLARHILYSKRYLGNLLGLDPASLRLCFEPDTFGHNGNLPEILAAGGIDYYYYCRGSYGPLLHRWQAPSGRGVLACREARWYLSDIEPAVLTVAAEYLKSTGSRTALNVYGVGDHGGGPTRADLDLLVDMAQWPCAPTIQFATCETFFRSIEHSGLDVPTVNGELNFRFPGCYSAQSRTKWTNRSAEAALYEAELLRACAADRGLLSYEPVLFEEAWRRTLFNQFHDILPGAGVIETHEFAHGEHQQAMARAITQKTQALQALTAAIDTSGIDGGEDSEAASWAEGAGAGFETARLCATAVGRHRGATRVFVAFNPLACDRRDPVELLVWDWRHAPDALEVRDASGQRLAHQVTDPSGVSGGHTFVRLLVDLPLPAFGYAACAVHHRFGALPNGFRSTVRNAEWRTDASQFVDETPSYTLENAHLCARFSPLDGALVSLVDKATGREQLAPPAPGGGARLRLLTEDPQSDAWRIFRTVGIDPLSRAVDLTPVAGGPQSLRQTIRWTLRFGQSSVTTTVTLDREARELVYECRCDWREFGSRQTGIPQLNFAVPLAFTPESFRYDRPFGTVTRPGLPHDVPASSWAEALHPENGSTVWLASASHNAFHGEGGVLSTTLLRATCFPDPYAEIGAHVFRFALGAHPKASTQDLEAAARRLAHPVSAVATGCHAGALPPKGVLLALSPGSVQLAAVKRAEDDASLVLRLCETDGRDAEVRVTRPGGIARACLTDLTERFDAGEVAILDGHTAVLQVSAFQTVTLRLR